MSTSEIISLLALGVAAVMAILSARRDTRSSGQDTGEIRTKLDSISAGVDDIRVDVRSMRDKQQDMAVRLAETEANCKSLSRRMDEHIQQYHSHAKED